MIPARRRLEARSERGAGLIGTIGGVMVFLTLLTFAVQLLFNLYATSAVTAVAYDAASMVASGDVDRSDPHALDGAVRAAEAHARSVLGEFGSRATFSWEVDAERVRLTVQADHPDIALPRVVGAFGLNDVERTVDVRAEAPR